MCVDVACFGYEELDAACGECPAVRGEAPAARNTSALAVERRRPKRPPRPPKVSADPREL